MRNLTFPQRSSTDTGFEVQIIKDIVYIIITDDWYGDSETGFGASLSFTLTKEQVVELRDFLSQII